MDAALIARCADPSLKPAIVEKFIAAAGAPDPLAVTVVSDGRLLLLPKPADADAALALVRRYVGHAVVRVGLTQVPAGIGAGKVEDIDRGLLDDCSNLKTGTALFAKVMRIVARWYGNPRNEEGVSLIFEDAIQAWKTGFFEGARVFAAPDPGGDLQAPEAAMPESGLQDGQTQGERSREEAALEIDETDIGRAGMRIDLSRIGG